VVYYGSISITQGYGSAGSQIEVYDAEIMGAVEGLQAAVNLPCASYSTGLVILLDNLAVASLLADGRPAPHRRKLTDLFQKLTTQCKSAAYILSTPRTPVEVRWIPGHSGIAGNETADELAKRGAALDGSHIHPFPILPYARSETTYPRGNAGCVYQGRTSGIPREIPSQGLPYDLLLR
jgi:ribonuclease HI